MDISKLQNGSDIRGVAIETENEKVNLTNDTAFSIGAAFTEWLIREKNIKKPVVTIGRDCRISGEKLSFAMAAGMESNGAEVIYFGLCTTPAMFMSTLPNFKNADAAVMVTASHLPFNRNGMKFFTSEGGLNKQDIKKVLDYAKNHKKNTFVDKTFDKTDFLTDYSTALISLIRQKTALQSPLSGMKIIVDAGNGCGGFFVDKVLKTLGADTAGSLYLEPDGSFPNHVPNPENSEVMKNFAIHVLENKADLGIVFDTDVDRAAIITANGVSLSRSRLIALMSDIILSEHPSSCIVTDSVTSKSLTEFINKRGGIHHRYKRGYNNVINEAKRLNEEGKPCYMAIETSGHCALKENGFLDDGAYLTIKALIKYSQLKLKGLDFDDLLKDYQDPAEEIEFRPEFLTEDFVSYGNQLLNDFKSFVPTVSGWSIVEPNYEGVRINCDKTSGDGWALLRMSLHDPVLPINIESDSPGGANIIKNKLLEFLQNYKLKING